jgi:tripeptide aminopeptidase
VVKTMLELIQFPSATPQKDPRFEESIRQNLSLVKGMVSARFQQMGITDIVKESNGSLIVRVPGSPGYENRRPLMLTAHLDIVPGDPERPNRPITPVLVNRGGRSFIATDGTTTLGADDKGGVAMIIDTVARLLGKHPEQPTPIPHVPLELLFSPDEESSCDSLKTLDSTKFKAKHVLVVDEFDAFKVTTGLASAVVIDIDIEGLQGGHSGADINKPNRLSAIMLASQIAQRLGTGVIGTHPQYPQIPLISKNIGLIQGGSAYNAIPEKARLGIMLRSASAEAQRAELERMAQELKAIERQAQAIQPQIQLKMTVTEEYPAWEANPASPLPGLASQASQQMGGPTVAVGPIHAAAQASILANKTNAYGEPFDAVLIGPQIEEAHTVRERIDWQSLVSSRRWLEQIIMNYTAAPNL